MYCDLNIPCCTQPDRNTIDKLKLILSRLSQVNECAVALNYTMEGFHKQNIPKPIDTHIFDSALLNSKYPLKLYTRLTIDTNQALDNHQFGILKETFDLIAIRTSSLDIFHAACHSYAIDIISLHCNERLAFELSLDDIKNALSRNVYFELCYAPSIRDNQARTYTLQLAKQLFQYTKGQHMIISSEAEIVSEIRNPADIFYFAKSIGLPNDKAKFTVEKHCEQLLNRCK